MKVIRSCTVLVAVICIVCVASARPPLRARELERAGLEQRRRAGARIDDGRTSSVPAVSGVAAGAFERRRLHDAGRVGHVAGRRKHALQIDVFRGLGDHRRAQRNRQRHQRRLLNDEVVIDAEAQHALAGDRRPARCRRSS